VSTDLEHQVAREEANYDMKLKLADGFEDDFGDNPSISERASEFEMDEEGDGQFLFVLEEGKKVTFDTLYERGTPVLYEFVLGSKGVKGAGDMGLIAFSDPDILLLVPARAGKIEVAPTYDGDGLVKHVTVRAHVKPLTVFDAHSAAGREALGA
jgi:hypothetical protein